MPLFKDLELKSFRDMKNYRFIVGLFFFFLVGNQLLNAQQIEWMSFEAAVEKSKVEPRKIFVDVYTEFCTYCKKMDRETFANPYIAKYLNENFYPVKLDAQQRNDIQFKNKVYHFVNRGGQNSYHQLAAEIMNGRLSYPTIVFMDENADIIQSIPGYRGPVEFELFITYFGKNHHKSMPWSSYKRKQPKGQMSAPLINVRN